MNRRLGYGLDSLSAAYDDAFGRRSLMSDVDKHVAEVRKSLQFTAGFSSLQETALRSSERLGALGGIDRLLNERREMERTLASLGGISGALDRHSAVSVALSAMGGFDAVMRRHDELRLLASRSNADIDMFASQYAASEQVRLALRQISSVTSLTTLFAEQRLDRARLDAVVTAAGAWQQGSHGTTLAATLRAQMPDLLPERRFATAQDLARASLSPLGDRFLSEHRRLEQIRAEMLGLRHAWVDVSNPGQSVGAYVEARALVAVVEKGAPESRAVVAAVRQELGDYRATETVPEVIVGDPVLRSAFRLEVGYNADLGSLPPAVIASIFGNFGGRVSRNFEADPEALESAVHQRARRLELKLRRFIERKMLAACGPRWAKQRVPGKTVAGWRARRQIDYDNGRTASRLFDYAGFEDYRSIIEQKDNWEQVFAPVFRIKTSILETLRRLSLIRNPDAHYRIVTIEDLIDLHVEGRRIDAWIDAAV